MMVFISLFYANYVKFFDVCKIFMSFLLFDMVGDESGRVILRRD